MLTIANLHATFSLANSMLLTSCCRTWYLIRRGTLLNRCPMTWMHRRFQPLLTHCQRSRRKESWETRITPLEIFVVGSPGNWTKHCGIRRPHAPQVCWQFPSKSRTAQKNSGFLSTKLKTRAFFDHSVHLIIPISQKLLGFTGLTFPHKNPRREAIIDWNNTWKRAIMALLDSPSSTIMEAIIPSKEKSTNISKAKPLGWKQVDGPFSDAFKRHTMGTLKRASTLHFSYRKIKLWFNAVVLPW